MQTLKLKLYFYVLFYILNLLLEEKVDEYFFNADGQIIYLTKIKYIIIYNG